MKRLRHPAILENPEGSAGGNAPNDGTNNLYKVMVVDDEWQIREGIIKRTPWHELGFKIVASAENGVEGLELAEKFQPDVVISDIKMDFMDGLEMAAQIRENQLATRFIMISGFDDFELAQRAIQLNVVEYLVKPINAEELNQILRRLKQEMDEEREQQRDMKRLAEKYESGLPLMREHFLLNLLEGRAEYDNPIEQFRNLELDIADCNQWMAGLFYISRKDRAKNKNELLMLSLQENVQEILSSQTRMATIFFGTGLAFIACVDHKNTPSSIIRALNATCNYVDVILDLEVTVGVGRPVDDPNQIDRSFQEARMALDYRSVVGRKRAIYIADVEPYAGSELPFSEDDARDLDTAVRTMTEDGIADFVEAMFLRYAEVPLTANYVQVLAMNLAMTLFQALRIYEISPENIFGAQLESLQAIYHVNRLEDLKDLIKEYAIKVGEQVQRRRRSSTANLALDARNYIEQNYANPDLSVEDLCNYLHVSPAYFSSVFKKETDYTFVAYLTHIRMREAARLLDATDDKTWEIAHKCGYTEPNYFSYVFKNHYGKSPTKWRREERAKREAEQQ